MFEASSENPSAGIGECKGSERRKALTGTTGHSECALYPDGLDMATGSSQGGADHYLCKLEPIPGLKADVLSRGGR